MNALHDKRIMNKKLYFRTTEKLHTSKDDENGDSIFMDISSDLSEVYLSNTFSPFGVVTTVTLYEDYKGGLCGIEHEQIMSDFWTSWRRKKILLDHLRLRPRPKPNSLCVQWH